MQENLHGHGGPLHTRDWEPVTITLQALSSRWKRRGRSKFVTSHYAWGTNGVCECKTDVKSTWIPTWHQTDHVSLSLGRFSKTTLLEVGDHGTLNAHNHRFILLHHVSGPARANIHWNSIWLRTQSHMTSHYAWGTNGVCECKTNVKSTWIPTWHQTDHVP